MRKFLRWILIPAGLIAVLFIPNLFLDPVLLPANDLHWMWILSGHDFFLPWRKGDGSASGFMVTNPELSRLGNGVDSFRRAKRPGVFRIFCVGGSTTRGWPFHNRLSYPRLLDLFLKDVLPGRRVEVINAGFMGSNSGMDLRLIRELSAYGPDLILAYEGRNERWDFPFFGSSRAVWLRARAWLLKTVRLYGWFHMFGEYFFHDSAFRFDQARSVREWLRETGGNPKNQEPLGDAPSLIRFLDGNLLQMGKEAARNHVRLIFLTQVVSPGEVLRGAEMLEINRRLRELASARKIELIDLDRGFEGAKGFFGGRLTLEPPAVHPDLSGYFLMAKTVCRALAERGLIAPSREWRWERFRSNGGYLKRLGVHRDFLALVYDRLGDFYGRLSVPEAGDRYKKRSGTLRSGIKLMLEMP